ncbi:MAG: glycosyltransferase family 4 protein [Desulfuromonadaceae bacterium]
MKNNSPHSNSTDRPLRILMIDSHAAIERGGAVQCASLARALARRGHSVGCIFDDDPEQPLQGLWFQSQLDTGVRVQRLPLRSPMAMLRLRRLLAREKPDILHTHKNDALFFAYFATLGSRRPVWTANRGTVYALSKNKLAHYIHRRHVGCMMAVAQAVKDVLVADGIPSEQVEVVYGSYDPERFHPEVSGEPARQHWGIPSSKPVIGLIGSLKTPKKGHPVLLEAVPELVRNHPELQVVLLGEGDPSPLREQAAALGIARHVHFPGFTDDVPTALAAMDVVVCASLRGEGLTGTLREALAMARPVVSSDVAGNRELVIDGQTGLLVPPGNPTALATAVDRLLSDRDMAETMAREGRQRVMDLCTEDNRAIRAEQIYRALLAAR